MNRAPTKDHKGGLTVAGRAGALPPLKGKDDRPTRFAARRIAARACVLLARYQETKAKREG